jgi:hypothetical protein
MDDFQIVLLVLPDLLPMFNVLLLVGSVNLSSVSSPICMLHRTVRRLPVNKRHDAHSSKFVTALQ